MTLVLPLTVYVSINYLDMPMCILGTQGEERISATFIVVNTMYKS